MTRTATLTVVALLGLAACTQPTKPQEGSATTSAVDPTSTSPTTLVVDTTAPPQPGCDPNYRGGCVPHVLIDGVLQDVDCARGGGTGSLLYDGPPLTVVGEDVFEMDGNGDGLACQVNAP